MQFFLPEARQIIKIEAPRVIFSRFSEKNVRKIHITGLSIWEIWYYSRILYSTFRANFQHSK